MSNAKTYFTAEDFDYQLPDPGFYTAGIKSARFRQSANKNRMLHIVHALETVDPAYQLVCDYFVLGGEGVTPLGIFLARRRLLHLYHACGIFPKEGDEIAPAQLYGCRLQVRVEHEQWQGRSQLRVVDYRPFEKLFDSDEQIPF